MSIVTINGERASTEVRTEDWYYYQTDAFQRLRAAPVAIDDLRALVDCAIGAAAYAIIGGSPWDEKTEAALETAKTAVMDGLIDKKPADEFKLDRFIREFFSDKRRAPTNIRELADYFSDLRERGQFADNPTVNKLYSLIDNPEAEKAVTEAAALFEKSIVVTDYFGGCPECGRNACVNNGRDHWLVCEEHKTRSLIGSNLFSSWRHETEADWERNRKLLSECEEVDFLPEGVWPRDPAARAKALLEHVKQLKAKHAEFHLSADIGDDLPF